MRYRLVGTNEQLAEFFEVCRTASSLMAQYQSLYISSWPLGGDMALGMCIALNEKVNNVNGAVHSIAKACGIKLEPLTEKESELADKVRGLEIKAHALRLGVTPEAMTEAFRRVIDYECAALLLCMKRCQRKVEWEIYQNQFNNLVLLRERMISPEWVLQFLDKKKFDMPEAKERVFAFHYGV